MNSEAEWQVWYRDTFDRECPPRVEASGRNIVQGLVELWAHFLFETVRPDGRQGFSRFHLWWQHTQISIKGDWEGATRLRAWVFGTQEHSTKGYIKAGNVRLLEKVARAHAQLIGVNQSSEAILAAAVAAADRQDFESGLVHIQGVSD